MRTPLVMSRQIKSAQKKLFNILKLKYGSLRRISLTLKTVYSNIHGPANLDKVISPFIVAQLCNMAEGRVMPHELRPDIFHPIIVKLYGEHHHDEQPGSVL